MGAGEEVPVYVDPLGAGWFRHLFPWRRAQFSDRAAFLLALRLASWPQGLALLGFPLQRLGLGFLSWLGQH